MKIEKDVLFILDTLNSNGYEAYVVGGCVRDFLMDGKPKDWDITTSATPSQVKRCFNKTFDTGIAHGTVTVVLNKINYEVTTYRIDGKYEDNRRPKEVFFTKDLIEDLKRRDFTMNAIAYHPKVGFVDPFLGMEDIKNKTIRGVGNAEKRFKEDALRILRAIRFSAQTDFDIEAETYLALTNTSYLIKNISIERIREELIKLFLSNYTSKVLILKESGILKYVSESLNDYFNSHINSLIPYINKCENNLELRFSLFFQYMSDLEVYKTTKFLKFDNKTIKEIVLLSSWVNKTVSADYYGIRLILSQIGAAAFEKLLKLKEVMGTEDINDIYCKYNYIITNNHCISLKQLDFNGKDLINLGYKNGEEVGNKLAFLLKEVLKNPELNHKNKLSIIIRELDDKN